MPMNSKPLSQRAPATPIWRRGSFAAALALGLAGAFSGPAAVASECSIEAHGEGAYERVQVILKNNMFKTQQINFAPYSEIDVELLPGCVFKIDGRFSVLREDKKLLFKRFHGEFKRKDGAPMGFKKLKFGVTGG